MADVSGFDCLGAGEDDFVSTYFSDLEAYQKEVAALHTGGCMCRGFHEKTLVGARGT